jgi:hypothetical protein
MRSLLITLTACTTALLLCGCPDLPRGVPGAQSEVPRKAPTAAHVHRDESTRAAHDSPAHAGMPAHQVSEIAWFQGTIDEAFSHRGCPESRPRRTLFRF